MKEMVVTGRREEAEEIKITDAMIEAGIAPSRLYDMEDPKSWEVAAIYAAMVAAAPKVGGPL